MTEWRETSLAEVSDLIDYGFTASAIVDDTKPRFLRVTDIVGQRIDWLTVPGCDIDDSKFAKFELREDDIVVARTGATVGHAKRIRAHPPAVFASYLVRFRPSKDVDASFVGAIVESQQYKDWVQLHAGGAAQPNANAKTLGKFPLRLPNRATQEKLGAVIGCIDDLIENNTRRIAILEELARAIYREWFVEFRYPGHEKVPLVDSELGPIPVGWERRQLKDLAEEVKRGIDPTAVPSDTPYIGLEHMPERSLAIARWGYAGDARSRKYKYEAGDILFGRIRPYFHKVGVPPVTGICSTDAIVIRPRRPEFTGLTLAVTTSDPFVQHAVQTSNGTKMPRAKWSVLEQFPVFVAPDPLLVRFSELIKGTLSLIHRLVLSNRNLANTRDLLLPRLVSGQIDASHIELPEAV